MSVWDWVAVGVGLLLAVSILVGFALARILGAVGRQISELMETEAWATTPPARAREETPALELDEKGARAADRSEGGAKLTA
jgi:hypothetical protein